MSPTDAIISQTILSVLCTVNAIQRLSYSTILMTLIDTLTITFLLQTAPVTLHKLSYKIGSSFRNHKPKTTNLVILTLASISKQWPEFFNSDLVLS